MISLKGCLVYLSEEKWLFGSELIIYRKVQCSYFSQIKIFFSPLPNQAIFYGHHFPICQPFLYTSTFSHFTMAKSPRSGSLLWFSGSCYSLKEQS